MILELKDICKKYRQRVVLNHINWQVTKPQTIALVAPNGTGKSTLLNIIANVETRDQGKVIINDLVNTDEHVYEEMTFMQDSSVLYPEMTGKSHIQLIVESYHIKAERVNEVIDRVGIGNYLSKPVKAYSMGMKQLLLFAMAILPNPKLLLLDEPLNGLDPKAIVMLRETLRELGNQGTTILFSSHNLDEIDRLTHHVVFLHNGQLVPASQDDERGYVVIMANAATVLTQSKWQTNIDHVLTPNKVALNATPTEITQIKRDYEHTKTPVLDVVLTHQATENQYFKLFQRNQIR